MRIKMLETFQGVGVSAVLADESLRVSILERDETYDADPELAEYLIANRKAEPVEIPAPTGQIPEAPAPQDDQPVEEAPKQPAPARARRRSRP